MICVILKRIGRSIDNIAYLQIWTVVQASLVVATARDAEVAELNQKLVLANADLKRVN